MSRRHDSSAFIYQTNTFDRHYGSPRAHSAATRLLMNIIDQGNRTRCTRCMIRTIKAHYHCGGIYGKISANRF